MINKTLTSFMRQEAQRKENKKENDVELHQLANDDNENEGPIQANITPMSPSNDEESQPFNNETNGGLPPRIPTELMDEPFENGIDGMPVHDTAIGNIGENDDNEPSISLQVNTAGNNNETPLGKDENNETSATQIPDDIPSDEKRKKTLKIFMILFAIIIFIVSIIIIAVMVTTTNNNPSNEEAVIITDEPTLSPTIDPTQNPTFVPTVEPTLEPSYPTRMPTTGIPTFVDWDTLPEPEVPFEYEYDNKTQNMTLSVNTTYFEIERTLQCIIEFDEDGNLDSNLSYIEMLDDDSHSVQIDSILLASAPVFEFIHSNCTLVPALYVTNIVNDTKNGILTLQIREAEMFEYIDELDCNITNGTVFDAGIDNGEITKLKNMANYFGNSTTVNNENGTNKTMTFHNVSYTELSEICYNVSENGTIINEIPLINGICDGLETIDYWGQKYGIDEISFGQYNVSGDDTNYSVPGAAEGRRRLFFKKFFKKVVKVVKKVVKKVVEFVEDVIAILKGDIDKRVVDLSLRIDATKTYKVSGFEDIAIQQKIGKVRASVQGTFEIETGVDFFANVYVDFVAKYKIFSKNPSFDKFKLEIGGETRFKAYVNVLLDGTVDIKYEVSRTQVRLTFFLGPIPIVIRPYGAISVGLKSSVYVDVSMEFGYLPASFKYGIEWNKKDNQWRTINEPLHFEPFKNFGMEMDDEQRCLYLSVTPYVEVAVGMVFYEILDVAMVPTIELLTEFQYPSTCDSNMNRCDYDPLQASFGITFQFNVYVRLIVGLLAPELEAFKINLPRIVKTWKLDFDIPSVKLFDKCFETQIDSNALFGESCCAIAALGEDEKKETCTKALTLDGSGTAPFDIGQTEFNKLMWNSRTSVIKRTCPKCVSTHQNIYYKRYTDTDTFNAYDTMITWPTQEQGVDFQLYSDWDDAINDNVNSAWQFCNYNDARVGAFRDCGPSSSVALQWTCLNPHPQYTCKNASFHICDFSLPLETNALCNVYHWNVLNGDFISIANTECAYQTLSTSPMILWFGDAAGLIPNNYYNASKMEIKVEMAFMSGYGKAGLVLRTDGNDNFYYVYLNKYKLDDTSSSLYKERTAVGLIKYVNGNEETLVPYGSDTGMTFNQATKYNNGKRIELKVVMDGPQITAFIDGGSYEWISTYDYEFGSGTIGLKSNDCSVRFYAIGYKVLP